MNWPAPHCHRTLFWALVITLPALGQVSESAPRFEVADVHPSTRSDFTQARGGLLRGGLYMLRHATMMDLVRTAYDVDENKILGGPSWLGLDRFDIRAKVPQGSSAAELKAMLRELLAQRFGLVAHRETRPVQAWALTVGEHPLLKRRSGSSESGCQVKEEESLVAWTCRNVTMDELISNLLRGDGGAWYYINDNLVVNQTNLAGAWDFDLKYSARWKTAAGGTRIVSLFEAVDKLGLKLDAEMVPMPVIVVDRVNRKPTPNSADADKAFPPLPTEFEVAAIRPANPDDQGDEGFQPRGGGLVNIRKVTLKWLVAAAWDITEETIVDGTKFMDSDRWDITAKAPDDAVLASGGDDLDQLPAMLQKLLTERFRLAVHFEERTMPALTLIARKPRMKKADPDSRSGCKEGMKTLVAVDPRSTNPTAARLLTCTNVSMDYLASHLRFLASGYVHSDVQNATGLEGGWDFTLSFSKVRQMQANEDPNGALSVQDALEKQLGLKLVTRKRPISVLVIDHIEQGVQNQ